MIFFYQNIYYLIKYIINMNININNPIDSVILYSKKLINIPYRWYKSNEKFTGDDKFWASNDKAVTAEYIKNEDKCIVCTGLINLMRRHLNLTIPGLNGNIEGQYKKFYEEFPGGTGAWYAYLNQQNRLEVLDINKKYPIGTLLIAPYQNDDIDQGHVAVIIDDINQSNDMNNILYQNIIHSTSTINYYFSDKFKNHGCVKIQPFIEVHSLHQKGYFKYVCFPENWLLLN